MNDTRLRCDQHEIYDDVVVDSSIRTWSSTNKLNIYNYELGSWGRLGMFVSPNCSHSRVRGADGVDRKVACRVFLVESNREQE